MLQELRVRVFHLLEVAQPGDRPGQAIDIAIVVLILLNVAAVTIETVAPIYARYGAYFDAFEDFSIAVFAVEYLLRIWVSVEDPEYRERGPLGARLRYMASPLAIVDLIAILPFFFSVFFRLDLRFLRILRLLRLFKLTRYSPALNLLYRVIRDEAQIIGTALFILLIVMVLASGGMYIVEHRAQPEDFGSIPATMWWTVSTLTTVGYGDVVPVTPIGKVFGALITLIGIGMVAFPAGILAAGFSEQIRRSRKAYRDRVAAVMADGVVTDAKVAELEETRAELGLSEDVASDLVTEGAARAAETRYCPHCGRPLHPS